MGFQPRKFFIFDGNTPRGDLREASLVLDAALRPLGVERRTGAMLGIRQQPKRNSRYMARAGRPQAR